ncbi:hypothetical protein [Circoviridae sp.]|nr:hypothetical protein [Circoviridae sp.]
MVYKLSLLLHYFKFTILLLPIRVHYEFYVCGLGEESLHRTHFADEMRRAFAAESPIHAAKMAELEHNRRCHLEPQ